MVFPKIGFQKEKRKIRVKREDAIIQQVKKILGDSGQELILMVRH